MSDIDNLQKKLIAGKNEQSSGFKKFGTAQFYNNLTKEQYSQVIVRPQGMLQASKDTLNPQLNHTNLKNRLEMIELYRYPHGKEIAHWPYYATKRFMTHCRRYAPSYFVKGTSFLMIVQTYRWYQMVKANRVETVQGQAVYMGTLGLNCAVFATLCAFI